MPMKYVKVQTFPRVDDPTLNKALEMMDEELEKIARVFIDWTVPVTQDVHIDNIPVLDEDDMVSDSDTNVATQQSIKAYVDGLVVAQNEFKELIDTPASYSGEGGKGVRVKGAEDGLEFYTLVDTDEKVKVGVAGVADYLNADYFERDVSNHIRIKQNTLLTGVDADKVDGEEASAIVTDARVKAHFPDTIANILSDHNLAAHTALGLFDEHSDVDHDQTTNYVAAKHKTLPNTIAEVLSDHNLAAHNALGITTLGTIGTGVWQGTAIANAYIAGIDQDLLQASSPSFIGINVSNIKGFSATVSVNDVFNFPYTTAGNYPVSAPMPKVLWHDRLAFSKAWGIPTFEVYDGSWSAGTLDAGLFSQQENRAITQIDGVTHTAARWTWNSASAQYAMAEWWVIGVTYVSPASSKDFLIESSPDGNEWTTRHTSTGNTANYCPVLLKMTSNAAHRYIRLTITVTNSQPLRLSSIRALSARWGDQGGGSEQEYPYTWNSAQDVTFPGDITVPKLIMGSYYLSSAGLVANNKVADSDKVDNEHVADIVTDARVKAHFPDTLANILSDHNLAAHTALGLFDEHSDVDHNQTTNYATNQHVVLPNTIANVLSNHNKSVHDSLGLDHGALSGKGDDDHTLYILASGTRAFTGVISGITPTLAAHLATKGYVDTQVGGVNEFIELTDTPANYTGSAGKFVKVNATPDGLEFVNIVAGDLPSHTHVKANITDTPWAWADVLKTGSNLTDLVTRLHSSLQSIGVDDHHAQSHTLASHSTKPHSALTGVTPDQHHAQAHVLDGAYHSISGKTPGHFLKALTATTFGFAAHGLTYSDVGAAASSHNHVRSNITDFWSEAFWGNIPDKPSSFTPSAHNLLSAYHGDTLVASVVRGDILVGNATPKWSRLAKGTSGKYLRSNGTDPAWATILDGDLPATIVRTSRSISTTYPLSGGGDLSANRTLSLLLLAADLGVNGSNQLYVKDSGIDHGGIGGLEGDDHTQYYNSARHTVTIHNALNIDADTLDTLHASSFALTTRKLDDFGTPDDNTDLNASITKHGLLMKLGGGTVNFLRADGTWVAPAGGAPHASEHEVGGGDLVNHDSLTGFVPAEHKSLPNTIAEVLSNHNLAVHNALAIDHGSLGGKGDDDHSQYYNSARHTVAIHDALNINADRVDGKHVAEASTVSTVVARNSSGDINARLFKSEYDTTNPTINYIMTQIDTVSNNYIRPSTPAQLRTALDVARFVWKTDPVTLSLTLDDTWRNYDATAITSANAKFIILSVITIAPFSHATIQFCQAGKSAWEAIFNSATGNTDGGQCIIKLDAGEVFRYKADKGGSDFMEVKCVGYIE